MKTNDKEWILKIIDLALAKLSEECLAKTLDYNKTGTLDLHSGLLCIKTTVEGSTDG